MNHIRPIDRAWVNVAAAASPTFEELIDSNQRRDLNHRVQQVPSPRFVNYGLKSDLTPTSKRIRTAPSYERFNDSLFIYRITSPHGDRSYGLSCLVDTDQIVRSPDHPGKVIRNEDVQADAVARMVAATMASGYLLPPVLLIHHDDRNRLHRVLVQACRKLGRAVAIEADPHGGIHELWPISAGPLQDRLCDVASTDQLIVADGNHRTMAATRGQQPQFLATITTAQSLTLGAYHRLVTAVPDGPPLECRLRASGVRLKLLADRTPRIHRTGVISLYRAGHGWSEAVWPRKPGDDVVQRLDHGIVERNLLVAALGLSPDDERIRYIGGLGATTTMCREVDLGQAELAIAIPPIPMKDFIAVNVARRHLPRKSTWFTPKPLTGLILAQHGARVTDPGTAWTLAQPVGLAAPRTTEA